MADCKWCFQADEQVGSLMRGDVHNTLRHCSAVVTTVDTFSTPLGASSFTTPVVRKRIVGKTETLPEVKVE